MNAKLKKKYIGISFAVAIIVCVGIAVRNMKNISGDSQNVQLMPSNPRQGNAKSIPIVSKSEPSKAISITPPEANEWRVSLSRELSLRHSQSFTELMQWAETFDNSNQYIFLVRSIAAAISPSDSNELLKWYRSKVAEGRVEGEISGVAGAVLANRGKLRDEDIVELCANKFFGDNYFQGLGAANSSDLERRIALIENTVNKDSFASSASRALADAGNFEKAIEVAQRISETGKRAEAFAGAASELVQKSPEEAVAWWNSLSTDAPDISARAAAGIVATWYYNDSLAASKWVQSLPEGAPKDAASSRIALQLCRTSLEDAQVWASSIKDNKIREFTLNAVARHAK